MNNKQNHKRHKKSKSTEDLILTIDNGTQSIRALLFDLKGNLVAKSQLALEAYFSSQPGWAEQYPDYFWQKLGEVCQQLWQQNEVITQKLKQRVVAMTLTTQRGTVINLDKNGKPLRPAVLWLDQRLADIDGEYKGVIPWYWQVLFAVVGQTKMVNYFRRKAQANWFSQNQAELWQNTDKFLLLSGFLTYKLTNNFKDSIGCQVGYSPFSYKKQQWSSKLDWKWYALQIKPSMLPELVLPGESLGTLTAEAAETIGLDAGLAVIASASDKACEVLGSGCIEPNVASISYGTTATINTNNEKYVEPQSFLPPFPSAIPHHYNSEVMIYRGFWMVKWFKREFGQHESLQAVEQGIRPEILLDELVKQVPAGSMGLMLQPYWSPGLKNLDAKGALIGFGDVHTKAHIYRAILEGLAYGLKDGKQSIEKRQKKKITQLMVSGGGSQSDVAMQLTADIFNLPVHRPHTFETSGLGAAINVAVGLGYFEDYKKAVNTMTRTVKTFNPEQKHVELYQQLFEQVYLKMYRQLKPLYKSIKKITGYPE